MTRFAPAPTGFLHLGHVVSAIYVWRLAREAGLRVMLRVEDHDQQRSQPRYEAALLDDLDWLGFVPDVYPTDAFRAGRCDGRQSDRQAFYEKAAADLANRGLLYGCRCSRRDIAAGKPTSGELRYPGTCQDANLPLDIGVTWRLRVAPGVESFDDALVGHQEQEPAVQCGDFAVRDRLGNWTYQFVASVDDFVQGVTLVVRGEDLLASTGRQLLLGRLLGRRQPATFAHHPLVMRTSTQKLSKSDGATGVRDLRATGWTPARVLEAAERGLQVRPA